MKVSLGVEGLCLNATISEQPEAGWEGRTCSVCPEQTEVLQVAHTGFENVPSPFEINLGTGYFPEFRRRMERGK
jgi:hypothetical protein